jgi:hypothetical protein
MASVIASAFQSWREANFQDPFGIESSENSNPDKDSLSNSIEYLFGLDPNKPESTPFVRYSHEVINSVHYAVFTYPPVAAGMHSVVSFEGNASLDHNGWSTLQNGINGVIIGSTTEGLAIKVTASGPRFTRLRVTIN